MAPKKSKARCKPRFCATRQEFLLGRRFDCKVELHARNWKLQPPRFEAPSRPCAAKVKLHTSSIEPELRRIGAVEFQRYMSHPETCGNRICYSSKSACADAMTRRINLQ